MGSMTRTTKTAKAALAVLTIGLLGCGSADDRCEQLQAKLQSCQPANPVSAEMCSPALMATFDTIMATPCPGAGGKSDELLPFPGSDKHTSELLPFPHCSSGSCSNSSTKPSSSEPAFVNEYRQKLRALHFDCTQLSHVRKKLIALVMLSKSHKELEFYALCLVVVNQEIALHGCSETVEAAPSADPSCDNMTVQGCCAGNTVRYCEGGTVHEITCGACGWNTAQGQYDCGNGGQADPSGQYPLACP